MSATEKSQQVDEGLSYQKAVLSSKSLFQTVVGEFPWDGGLVGIDHVDASTEREDCRDEEADLEETLSRAFDPGIHLWREAAEQVVLLMNLQHRPYLINNRIGRQTARQGDIPARQSSSGPACPTTRHMGP